MPRPVLTDVEDKAANDFANEHYHRPCRNFWGKNNPRWQIKLELVAAGGIGTGVDVVCPHCGERKDITDYDSW